MNSNENEQFPESVDLDTSNNGDVKVNSNDNISQSEESNKYQESQEAVIQSQNPQEFHGQEGETAVNSAQQGNDMEHSQNAQGNGIEYSQNQQGTGAGYTQNSQGYTTAPGDSTQDYGAASNVNTQGTNGGGIPPMSGPQFSYMDEKPKKNNSVMIALGIILAILIIGGGTVFAFRMDIMRTMSPGAYVVKAGANTGKSFNSMGINNAKQAVEMTGTVRLDEAKIGPYSLLDYIDGFTVDFDLKSDILADKNYLSYAVGTGGKDKISLELYQEASKFVVGSPTLFEEKISFSDDSKTENEIDPVIIRKAITSFGVDFSKELGKTLKNSKYESNGTDTLTVVDGVSLNQMTVTIPAKELERLSKKMPDLIENNKDITELIDMYHDLGRNNMTSKEFVAEMRESMEEFSVDESLVFKLGITKDHKIAKIEVLDKNNVALFTTEFINDKKNGFGVNFVAADEVDSMKLLIKGKSVSKKDTITTTIDSVELSVDGADDDLKLAFSGEITQKFSKSIDFDYDASKAIYYEDLTDENMESIYNQMMENLAKLDVLPDDLKEMMKYSESNYGVNDYEESTDGEQTNKSDKSEVIKPERTGAFSEPEEAESISYQSVLTPEGVLVLVKNNGEQAQKVDIQVIYYDENDNIVGTNQDYIIQVNPGQEQTKEIYLPYDSDYEDVSFSRYEVSVTGSVDEFYLGYYKNAADALEITSNQSGNKVITQFTNNTEEEFSSVEFGIIYYKDGKVVGYNEDIEMNVKPGKTVTEEQYPPYDEDYNDIPYDDYKIYLNSAYVELNTEE
jgi:hypothetical protein